MATRPKSQICLAIQVLGILSGDIDFDTTEYVYKDQSAPFVETFEFVVTTLNDIIFSTLYIVISKKSRNFLGLRTMKKMAGAGVRIIGLVASKNTEFTADLIPVIDLMSADYYDKNPPLLGKIRIRFDIKLLDEPLVDDMTKLGFTRKLVNKLFSADLSSSFDAINDITSFLASGSAVCNFKSIAGMLLIDGYLIKKITCETVDHEGTGGCFRTSCITGYGNLPPDEAKTALKEISYCVASFLDAKLWALLFKPVTQFSEEQSSETQFIKDRHVRAALTGLGIPHENFIKYYEGSHQLAGFIMFIDDGRLVVSFRGTLSSTDVINDLDASYAEFFSGYAHSGMLRLAKRFIETELENIKEILTEKKLSELHLVGYSLGGGVAALLHVILMKRKLTPGCRISTVTFASPPTVSESFVDRNIPNLLTYNYGNDIVPRLSLGSLLDFKYLCLSIANIFDLFSKSEVTLNKIAEIHRYLEKSNIYPKLYHPGIVYHAKLCKSDEETSYGIKRVDPRFFGNLVIYKDNLPDHMLQRLVDVFESCINHDGQAKAVSN